MNMVTDEKEVEEHIITPETHLETLANSFDILQAYCKDSYFILIDPGHTFATSLDTVAQALQIESWDPFQLDTSERLAALVSLAPHFCPGILAELFQSGNPEKKNFPILGGKSYNGINYLPTIDTVLYLLGQNNLIQRKRLEYTFRPDGPLLKNNIIQLEKEKHELWNQSVIKPTKEFVAFNKGYRYSPGYSADFPASKLETKLEWKDLALPYDTYLELKEIRLWLDHGHTLYAHPRLSKIVKPGYRCLFYGPPGTGKTLTASLLGKLTGKDVYRIDLSMIVSKWIGETEKNLKRVFDIAQDKNWILFFDEADSLFGKRTQTKSSNDRHANQEVAYLLQRIEDFPGIIVLASNLKDNIDEAFARRFQSMIYFPIPDAETRLRLWQQSFPEEYSFGKDLNLDQIANRYEIAGGTIINIIRYCVLMALEENRTEIYLEDLEHAVRKEQKKEGKIIGD